MRADVCRRRRATLSMLVGAAICTCASFKLKMKKVRTLAVEVMKLDSDSGSPARYVLVCTVRRRILSSMPRKRPAPQVATEHEPAHAHKVSADPQPRIL